MALLARLLPLFLLLLVAMPVDAARAQQIERIEIVEWGLYRADRTGQVPSPSSPSGTSNLSINVRHRETTTTVPALVGITFGLRYEVVGSPSGAAVDLKLVVRFPERGVTDPATGKSFRSAEYEVRTVVGAIGWEAYTLDYEWEVEPGPWTLELWHEGRRLARKTFMVTRLVSSAGRPAPNSRRLAAPSGNSKLPGIARCPGCCRSPSSSSFSRPLRGRSRSSVSRS
jgi:hypothetical protein